MARDSFYSDNAARDFPFLKGDAAGWLLNGDPGPDDAPYRLPYSAIVACGFMLGPGTGFVPGQHTVKMVKILRTGGRFWFYFTSDAPGLVGQHLAFSRDEDARHYSGEYLDLEPEEESSGSLSESNSESASSSASSSESSSLSLSQTEPDATCNYVDTLIGFIVTGSLEELCDLVEDGDELTGEARVEPALLQSLVNTYARSINLANGDRTRYRPPSGCDDPDWPNRLHPLYVGSTCLAGKIVFVPGYNAVILQNDFNNSLTFSAAVGAGAGEPCTQVPVFEGETPPDDSLYLEGGPACNEVIRTVAGMTGPVVQLEGGDGVNIAFDPTGHKITVDVDLHSLSVCGDELIGSEVEE
jgi:hypothetical protein